MEHGSGARRTPVQIGTAWRAWGRIDRVPAARIFPWRAGAGAAWICVVEHRPPPPMDDRPHKSCRRVTQNGQVPRPQPANCRCGGGLPVDQAACRRLVRSCRQKRRRGHDGKAVARLHPRRARCGNSLPQPPAKRPAPQAVAVHGNRGRNRTADTGSSIKRFTSISGSTVRRASVNQAQKPQPLAVPVLQCAITFSQRFHGKVTWSRLKKEKCSGLNPGDSSSRLNSSGPRPCAREHVTQDHQKNVTTFTFRV